MEDRPFEFNGIPVKTPDTFKANGATTSTEDSGRVQTLEMKNNPMGTIESYSIEWKYIELWEAARIIQQIKNKSEYSLRYLSLSEGIWRTDQFYTTNYNSGSLRESNGMLVWEFLAFNAILINPI